MKVLDIVNNKLIFGVRVCNLNINNNINKDYEVTSSNTSLS
ncbi:MAG: hypothetical protein ACLUNR_03710 [Bacilli bacterium]